MNEQFFSEFPPVSKAEWLAQVARDLKGRQPEELIWNLSGELAVTPFVHLDDAPPAPPLAAAPGWEICEAVDAADPAAANAQALEALTFGAETLRFELPASFKSDHSDALLASIHLDYIGLQFAGPGMANSPAALLAALAAQAAAAGLKTTQLRGALAYDPAATPGLHDWRYLAELIAYAREQFPGFQVVTIDGAALHQGPAAAPDELAGLLTRANTYLEKLAAHGVTPAQAAAQIRFSVSVGQSYFVEIAKLRALRLLWLNVLKAWGLPLQYPAVDARFHPGAYTDALYTNMIRATTMAMSAVLGGAQSLTVLPYDAGREEQAAYPRAFARRIARNVQHLLKLESGLDRVSDPAAGSYYIEQLTGQLATLAWGKMGH